MTICPLVALAAEMTVRARSFKPLPRADRNAAPPSQLVWLSRDRVLATQTADCATKRDPCLLRRRREHLFKAPPFGAGRGPISTS